MRSISHNANDRAGSRFAARRMLLRRAGLALLLGALATPLLAAPQQALGLRAALRQARTDNPYARIQELRVRAAELAVDGVEAMRVLPVLRWQQSFGVVPEARGDILFSPDSRNDLDNLGPYYRTTIALLQPVYTFGRIKHGLEATRLASDATAAERDQALEELSEEVIRAFWGLAAARRLVQLAGEAEDGYATLLQEVETRAADDDSLVDDVDVMEVRSFGYAVVRFAEEARAREATAASALLALLARAPDEQLTLAPEEGPDWTLDHADLASLHRLAERSDGELVALRSKIPSQQARADLARAERFPLVLLGAGFRYAYAPNRDPQDNPFVRDTWNFRAIGLALTAQWDLNFRRQNIEVAKVRTQSDRLVAQAAVRRLALRHEVDSVFAQARKTRRLVEAAEESLRAARTWLRLSLDNWSLGIGDTDRLLRAYETFYRLSGEAVETRFAHDVAVARAALTVGDEALYLSWVESGEIVVATD